MHSVKNRFLMRIKNATSGLYRRYWLPMTLRDLLVVGGSLLGNPPPPPPSGSWPAALPRALHRRRAIMARRRVSDRELAQWFRFQPAAMPVVSAQPEAPLAAAAVQLVG